MTDEERLKKIDQLELELERCKAGVDPYKSDLELAKEAEVTGG